MGAVWAVLGVGTELFRTQTQHSLSLQGSNKRTHSQGTEAGTKPSSWIKITHCPHFAKSKETENGTKEILRRDPQRNLSVWDLVGRHKGDGTLSFCKLCLPYSHFLLRASLFLHRIISVSVSWLFSQYCDFFFFMDWLLTHPHQDWQ